MNYRKCIACQRGWVNRSTAAKRVEWATSMLERYLEPEGWYRVRFSDEHKLRIIRKPGQRYCPDCIQHKATPAPKNEKQFHCWAAVGFNFKSNIHFYNFTTNQNVVKPWLEAKHNFVLEEDGDSGHGLDRGRNIVKNWKEQNGLEHYFNCA
ncbi:MAG: hypothetical protein M1824_004013 [Vezdaea acicularis]|nr:MAG: hypothetical protein M1824_004013 [Vezdaea acicularis]